MLNWSSWKISSVSSGFDNNWSLTFRKWRITPESINLMRHYDWTMVWRWHLISPTNCRQLNFAFQNGQVFFFEFETLWRTAWFLNSMYRNINISRQQEHRQQFNWAVILPITVIRYVNVNQSTLAARYIDGMMIPYL